MLKDYDRNDDPVFPAELLEDPIFLTPSFSAEIIMMAIEPLFCRPSWTLVNPTELVPDLDPLTVQVVVHVNGVDADQAQLDPGQP